MFAKKKIINQSITGNYGLLKSCQTVARESLFLKVKLHFIYLKLTKHVFITVTLWLGLLSLKNKS